MAVGRGEPHAPSGQTSVNADLDERRAFALAHAHPLALPDAQALGQRGREPCARRQRVARPLQRPRAAHDRVPEIDRDVGDALEPVCGRGGQIDPQRETVKAVSELPQVMSELQAKGRDWGKNLGRDSMHEVLAEHPDLETALEAAAKSAQH